MRLGYPERDRESKTCSAAGTGRRARAGSIDTVEPFENVGLRFGRDATSRIDDRYDGVAVLLRERGVHLAASRGVFQRIVEQIQEHLPEQILVTGKWGFAE